MSYYTDKILANYNKGRTNYKYDYYNEGSDEEEESEMMTDQYEEDSNEISDNNKYTFGSNIYGLGKDKSNAGGGISKYLNPGKLMSDTQNFDNKKLNPYAKSVSYEPYKSDTYNIDIDLNKIKKDSEMFKSTKIEKNQIGKKIDAGWIDADNDDEEDDKIYKKIQSKYDLPDEIKFDTKSSKIEKNSDKNLNYKLNNEEEIEKFLNERIEEESDISKSRKSLDKGEKKLSYTVKSKSLNSKSKIESYHEDYASKLNDKSKSHLETGGDNKDSTISIEKFMNLDNNKNPIGVSNQNNTSKNGNSRSQISIEDDYSYNKFTESHKDVNEKNILKKLDDNQTAAYVSAEEIKSQSRKNYDTITSDPENKYNDFVSASKLENHSAQSEIEEEIYNKFDEISSHLESSHNLTPSISYNIDKTLTPKNSQRDNENKNEKSFKSEINSELYQSMSILSQSKSLKENQIKSNINEIKNKENTITNTNTNIIKNAKSKEIEKYESITQKSHDKQIPTTNPKKSSDILQQTQNIPYQVNNSSDLKLNNEYIQNIIIEEFRKLINPIGNNQMISSSHSDVINRLNLLNSASLTNSQNLVNNNPTNIQYAKEEVKNRLVSYLIDKSENFLIYSDSHNKLKKFDSNKLNIKKTSEINFNRAMPPKRDIREMKLQLALDEERKQKEYYEMNYQKSKETIEDLEIKLKKFRKLEIENLELKKINLDTETKYSDLEKEFRELKFDYENKIKYVEERVILSQSKSENKKIMELTRNFEIEIENLKNEIKEKNSELEEYKNKCEYLEEQNTKLSINKISNLETNDKIKELRNENFILHERCNELLNKLEKSQVEKEKLETKIFHKEILFEGENEIFENFEKTGKFAKNLQMTANNFYQSSFKSTSNKFQSPNFTFNKKNQNIPNEKLNTFNQFDQILIEREFNVQETIIKSYIKEIEKLNSEIQLLKKITANGENQKTNNFIKKNIFNKNSNSFTNFNFNTKTENQKNFKSSKYSKIEEINVNKENSLNSENSENNFIKESAEAKIKILKKYLTTPNEKNATILTLENEFQIYEKSFQTDANKNLKNSKNSSGEFDLETFLKILKKLNVPLSKYELIEIFNNFPKISKNKIRLSDLILALKSERPYNFFIQSDPHYLTELETKIVFYENKISILEKEIEILKQNEITISKKNSEVESEKKELEKKLKELTNFNENCMGMILNMNTNKNNFRINSENSDKISEEEIKKLNEKIKILEKENSNVKSGIFKDFEAKISQYEEKFKTLSEKNLSSQNFQKENEDLKKINFELLNQIRELEFKNKNKNEKIEEKLLKYKQNYRILKDKLETTEKEKEKIFKNLNQILIKSGNEKLNSNMIQNFFLNSDQIDHIIQKIENLETKNKERDEYYRQLCYKTNSYQVSKEIETVTKKFEADKKEYLKIINHKNSELIEVKKDFEELLRELEEIKINKRLIR